MLSKMVFFRDSLIGFFMRDGREVAREVSIFIGRRVRAIDRQIGRLAESPLTNRLAVLHPSSSLLLDVVGDL
jgi:hypothetical protein